jgi:MFS family permease
MSTSDSAPQRLTLVQWLVCAMAAIGFAFDIYVLLLLPVVQRHVLQQFGIKPATPEFESWSGMFFFLPAAVGGIFGLAGGYLTDLLGRRRVLTWSIFLYAFSTFAAGFSTSPGMFLVCRCTAWVGVCVEFVAAVAWLAELFQDPKQREKVLGYTQAFSSTGGLLVAGAHWVVYNFSESFPAILGGHDAWRYEVIAGVIPAIPLMIIRPFLPESPEWQRKKAAGLLKRPSIVELFRPAYRRTTLVTTLMFACSYGAAFGAIQQLPRIVPDLPSVKEQTKPQQETVVSAVQFWQEIGGLAGRVALAALAVVIVSRRSLMRVFQLPGLIILPLVCFYPAKDNLELLKVGVFFAGLCTVAQFSFWGNYLPRVYPLHLRGTGESFAANIGGRVIGTSAALLTTKLAASSFVPGSEHNVKVANAAAAVALLVYAVGSLACFWLPEPEQELPAD